MVSCSSVLDSRRATVYVFWTKLPCKIFFFFSWLGWGESAYFTANEKDEFECHWPTSCIRELMSFCFGCVNHNHHHWTLKHSQHVLCLICSSCQDTETECGFPGSFGSNKVTTFCWFLCPLMDIWVVFTSVKTAVTTAAGNIHAQITVWTPVFNYSGYTHRHDPVVIPGAADGGNSKLSSILAAPFYPLPIPPHPSFHLVLSVFWIIAYWLWDMEWAAEELKASILSL